MAEGDEATVTVSATLTKPGLATNTATLPTEPQDPNRANNTATAETVVTPSTMPGGPTISINEPEVVEDSGLPGYLYLDPVPKD